MTIAEPVNAVEGERLAYLKHSDAAYEVLIWAGDTGEVPEGGPLHYISSVLNWNAHGSTLVISYGPRCGRATKGNATGITLQDHSRSTPMNLVRRVVAFLQTLGHLLRFRPTRVLCAAIGPRLWAAYLVASVYGARFVCTRHGQVMGRFVPLDKWFLSRADAIMVHTQYLEDEIRSLLKQPPPIYQFNLSYRYLLESCHPNPGADQATTDIGAFTVLYVGRIVEIKGVVDLFTAIEPLMDEYPALQLTYIGDGPQLEELNDLAKSRGFRERVRCLGQIPHGEVVAQVKRASVVVTPSRAAFSEARCKAAVEAIVLGVPVIAPKHGPFPTMVEHERNGLLFESDSALSLRQQLKRIIADPDLWNKLRQGAEDKRAFYLDSRMDFKEALRSAFS